MQLSAVILRNTRALQPAANTVPVGTLYFVTDESIIERSTGAAWESYSGAAGALGINQLTGDVTAGPGVGSQAATIAAGAVDYAMIQNVSATARILSRKTAGAGVVEEATLSEILDFITSAAQGDILFRGAALWERLGAGTSGHFLKTQGAAADPVWAATAAASNVFVADLELSDAQIKSLNSVPITIIAAQGANQYIHIISCFTIKDSAAGAYNTASNFSLRYSGGGVDLTTPVSLYQGSANKRWQNSAIPTAGNTSDESNTAVVAYQAADITGGNAANYLRIRAVYSVVDDA